MDWGTITRLPATGVGPSRSASLPAPPPAANRPKLKRGQNGAQNELKIPSPELQGGPPSTDASWLGECGHWKGGTREWFS